MLSAEQIEMSATDVRVRCEQCGKGMIAQLLKTHEASEHLVPVLVSLYGSPRLYLGSSSAAAARTAEFKSKQITHVMNVAIEVPMDTSFKGNLHHTPRFKDGDPNVNLATLADEAKRILDANP